VSYRVIFAAAVLLGAYGCALPPPPTDPRLVIMPDLPLVADAPSVTTSAGLMRVTLRLVNGTPQDLPVLTITDWLDEQGRPIASLMSAPMRMAVPRYGDAVMDRLAPRPSATSFHIYIEPDRAAF
jgi:Protein of unknown function (DUF1425)